jgi:hypothetical protein
MIEINIVIFFIILPLEKRLYIKYKNDYKRTKLKSYCFLYRNHRIFIAKESVYLRNLMVYFIIKNFEIL